MYISILTMSTLLALCSNTFASPAGSRTLRLAEGSPSCERSLPLAALRMLQASEFCSQYITLNPLVVTRSTITTEFNTIQSTPVTTTTEVSTIIVATTISTINVRDNRKRAKETGHPLLRKDYEDDDDDDEEDELEIPLPLRILAPSKISAACSCYVTPSKTTILAIQTVTVPVTITNAPQIITQTIAATTTTTATYQAQYTQAFSGEGCIYNSPTIRDIAVAEIYTTPERLFEVCATQCSRRPELCKSFFAYHYIPDNNIRCQPDSQPFDQAKVQCTPKRSYVGTALGYNSPY